MNKVFGNSKIVRGKHYVQDFRDEEFDLLIGNTVEYQNKNDSIIKEDSGFSFEQKNISDFNSQEISKALSQKVTGNFPGIFTADTAVVFYWAFTQLYPAAQRLFCEEYSGDSSLSSLCNFLINYGNPSYYEYWIPSGERVVVGEKLEQNLLEKQQEEPIKKALCSGHGEGDNGRYGTRTCDP